MVQFCMIWRFTMVYLHFRKPPRLQERGTTVNYTQFRSLKKKKQCPGGPWWSHFCQANEAHFEHRRLRDRQNSLEYDPDNDDFQMIVMPCSSKWIEYEEKRLIQKQIHQLFHRIQGGGAMCPACANGRVHVHYRRSMSRLAYWTSCKDMQST